MKTQKVKIGDKFEYENKIFEIKEINDSYIYLEEIKKNCSVFNDMKICSCLGCVLFYIIENSILKDLKKAGFKKLKRN